MVRRIRMKYDYEHIRPEVLVLIMYNVHVQGTKKALFRDHYLKTIPVLVVKSWFD